MPTGPIHIQGMAYTPGDTCGPIRPGPGAGPGSVALITQGQIGALTARHLRGVILVDGAPFSHAAIGLRALGVPTVIVDADQAAALAPGMRVRLDGCSGRITDADGAPAPRPAPPPPAPGRPVETADGAAVRLRASVGDAGGARRARACGAEAVGLVRSELLGPEDGARPDAAFYRTALARLCRDAAPLPVNLRLMDIAPDKRPSWMRLPAEGAGPLGLQGARLFGVRAVRQVVEAQLEAVHDLAGEYDLGLIIPYLTRRDELEHWAAWARARVGAPVRLGAMVETPAAALDLAGWPRCADFAGLGCNDLMQCLFAADRDVPALRGFLDPCAPVLYRFLREVARSAGEHIDRVQLCGVLPQLAGVLPVLVGLGFRTFSVDAPLIPWLAEQVRGLSLPACRHLAADACRAPTGAEVAGLLGVAPSPAPRFGD